MRLIVILVGFLLWWCLIVFGYEIVILLLDYIFVGLRFWEEFCCCVVGVLVE